MEDGHDAGADVSADDVEISAAAPKGRGRLRICKQCKFTCTDSIEFLQHQTKAHGEGDDSHPSKKAALKVAVIKKRTSRSESEISMDSMTSEKVNGEEVPFVTEMYDEPEHEDDRLIIAEENDQTDGQDPSSVTPTRCGNIQNRTYVCNVCEFTSTSAKTYLHHQKDDHKYDFTIYECDICEYATKYKQKLPRHRKLHFSGQEGMLLPNNTFEETPNNSLLNHSQEEEMSMIGEEDDDEIDEEEDDPVVTVIPQPVIEVPFIPEKKKKTRQEVDPAKYFEVVDDTGIKYACSSCGNVYKWRKSLNKHWKEKHGGEVPDGSKKPPGLMYLVNSGNHTMYGKRRIYSNSVLASMQQPSSAKSPSVSQSPSLVRAETPVSMGSLMNGPSPITSDYTETTSAQPVVFPKFIGPFVNNTTPSAYTPPTATSIQDYVSAHIQRQKEEVEGAKRSPQSNSGSQEQPLDFSVRKDDNPTLDPSFFKVKMEPLWMGDEDPKASLTDESSKNNNAILQCTKCSFVAKTLVDYSSHMTLHLNRRAFKCAVCQEHFNGVEDLNKHFLDEHAEKIQEHKDAIQKIPHGLQQTYHLLKMPLDAITHLSSQDLSSTDSKQLKCNMCDFVAKWPAELQKHAVSHSEERPFMCMVCGSTYKWKWDLVKHFEKSHHTLPNPYKRRETLGGGANKSNNNDQSHTSADDSLLYSSTTDDLDDLAYMQRDGEPMSKRRRMSDSDMPELIPKPRDDDHIAVFDDSRDLGIGKNILEAPSLYAERPSSLPSKLDSYADPDHSNDDEHSTSSIKITNVQSLYDDEMDYLLYKHDADSMIQRPVTEETQKAIAATVRQRLNNLDSQKFLQTDMNSNNINSSCADILLPYKCPKCEYRARWPSEITQHMKNHSDEKPYHCPRCNYRSKWKWDVVKHLKRCGGGTIKDVIDTSRCIGSKRIAPPNVTVLPEGKLQQQTPQPVAYLVSSNNTDHTGGQGAVIVPIMAGQSQGAPPLISANQGNTPIQPKPVNTGSSHQVKQGNNSHSSKQPVFRSLINQGLYHCLECPFVGHSPAELKRHSVLHSENKPFTCGTCGYSSRWKCDLKKHMRTYNHFSSQVSRSPGLNGDDSGHTDSDEPDRPERQVFTCTKCPYATTKHHILETHMKIHGTPSSSSSSPAKFKCKQCDFQVNDLSNFLQHRVTHSNQNAAASAQASPSPSDPQRHEEIDAARLKHPRKAMKRLQCSKCDFVCSKRETMEIHEAEHEKELNYKCFYCDMTVNDKESLLDHISTHTEFNPDEWETFFMEDDQSDEEDDHLPEPTKFTVARSTPTDAVDVPSPPPLKMFHPNQQRANTIAQKDFHSVGPPQLHIPRSMQNSQQVMSSKPICSPSSSHLSLISGNNGRSAGSISSIHSRNIPQQQTSKSNHVSGQGYEHSTLRNIQPAPAVTRKRFTCEWCEAMFAHVTTLYQHAKNVHPLELRKQELAEAARSSYQDSSSNHQSSQNQNPQRPQQRQQQQQQQQQLSHRPKPLHLVSSPQNNQPRQSLVSENKRQFLDTLRHILPNDSKQSNIHNTHVKSQGMTAENITSTLMRAKKSTSPQKKARSFQCTKCPFTAPNAVTYLRHVERHGSNCKHTCWFCDYSIDRLNLLYQHMKGSHSDKWKGSESEMQLPAGPAPTYPIIVEDDPHTMEKIRAELNFANNYQKNKKPVLILKEQMTWRGVPIQICSMDGKKSYKCPKCSYVNSNIANAANHVRQHGSNRKYQCKYCDYCSDNLKLIYQHMDKVHPKEPAFIEVTKNIEVGSADIDSDERENAEMEGEMDAEMEASMEENMLMSCPKCPFKAKLYDIYRAHVLMHTYNGQYKCEHCDYSVDDLGILTRHAVVHEEKDSEKDGSLTPEKKHFTSMLNLKRVNDEAPLPAKSSPNKAAELATKLLTMQARQVLQKSRLSGRVRYRCSRCPYNTFCKNNIIKHRKQHIIKSRYKCPLCNYSASRAYLLQQHIKFHKTENNSPENSAEKSYQDIVLDPLDKSNKEYEKLQEEIEAEAESRPDGAGEEVEGEDDMDLEEEVTEEEPEGEEEEPDLTEADVDMEEKTDGNNTGEEGENALSILSQHRSYRCKDCPFSSNSGTEFRKHCLLHGAAHRYKCDFCSYSLDRLNLLTQHRRLHADEPDFDPAPPPSALLNLDVLRLESEKHVEKVSSTLENSESAEPEPVEESESEPMRYSCPNCPFKSNALKSYNVHFQMHGIKKKYICDYCDWSIDRLNLLYQHRRVHTKQPGFNPSPDEINILNRDYALEAPGKFEAQIMGFNKHVENDNKSKETVEKKNLYNCKSCPFSTSNKNSFAYHKMLHRMRARYMCPECTYSVDRWNLLNQHLRLHQDTKKQQESEEHQQGQMKCPKCPYLSPSTEILESHLGMHGSENKFNCQFCDFSVETIVHLQQHVKVHEERSKSLMSPAKNGDNGNLYEPQSPDVVNPQLYFSSPDDTNLSEDSEEMELKCDRCPFSTTSKEELDRHDNQHNTPNCLPCCYCDFSCSAEEELQDHIEVHFPGTAVDKEVIKSIITKYQLEKNNNSLTEAPAVKEVAKSPTETSTPDSTVGEDQKTQKDSEEDSADARANLTSTSSRTKVYVCQYCEREFENKSLMMQHERQHLIGHQY